MKRLLIILGFSGVLFSACSKNSGPADQPSIQPNNKLDTLVSMTATIGACNFSTTDAYGYNLKTIQSGSSGVYNLMINGSQKRNDSLLSISMTVNGYNGPDTYKINPPFVTATWYVNNQRHYATWGNIVIANDTAYALTGSFLFLADSIYVSNGVFNVLTPF